MWAVCKGGKERAILSVFARCLTSSIGALFQLGMSCEMLVLQVQTKSLKEVSLLDLDDCEFDLKQKFQRPLKS